MRERTFVWRRHRRIEFSDTNEKKKELLAIATSLIYNKNNSHKHSAPYWLAWLKKQKEKKTTFHISFGLQQHNFGDPLNQMVSFGVSPSRSILLKTRRERWASSPLIAGQERLTLFQPTSGHCVELHLFKIENEKVKISWIQWIRLPPWAQLFKTESHSQHADCPLLVR